MRGKLDKVVPDICTVSIICFTARESTASLSILIESKQCLLSIGSTPVKILTKLQNYLN